MKQILTAILLICLFNTSFSQNIDSLEKNWRAMLLSYRDEKGFHHFDLDHRNLQLNTDSDSTPNRVITIDSALLHPIFQSLKNGFTENSHTLSDSDKYKKWSQEKAEHAWFEYTNKQFDRRSNEIAIDILQEFNWIDHRNSLILEEEYAKKPQRLSLRIFSEKSVIQIDSRIPFVEFDITYEKKHSKLYSTTLFNALESLFQFRDSNFVQTIEFEQIQMQFAYELAIKDSLNAYWSSLVRSRDKKSMEKLEQFYPVTEAYVSTNPTIDWGNRKRVTLILNARDFNVHYSLTYDYSFLLNLYDQFSPHIFAYKHRYHRGTTERMEDSLLNNPVIDYCTTNYGSKGIVHYVRRRSLSFKAKQQFKKDFKSSGQDKNLYKGKLKNAILFELQEGEPNDYMYHEKLVNVSYWVFLEDGTIVLWQSSGDNIMNFPKEFITGTKCKVISNADFHRYTTSKK